MSAIASGIGNESFWTRKFRTSPTGLNRSLQERLTEIETLLEFGGDPTGVAPAQDFITAGLAVNEELVIPVGTYRISANYTVPAHKHLIFQCGGKLMVDAGVTLTINGTFEAGLWLIFSGPGTVKLTGPFDWVSPQWWGAVDNGTTNNTALVQKALDALPEEGGLIVVPRGTKFDLGSLIFPIRSNVRLWADDNINTSARSSFPNPDLQHAVVSATNELTEFVANANSQGIVNELRYDSTFHTGLVINTCKSITGHNAWLNPGNQFPLSPVRSSINFHDDNVGRYRIVYQHYAEAYSNLSGIYQQSWLPRYTLVGIKTTSFVSVPAVGALITGVTSGAKGFLISIDATQTVLNWISGSFVAGERVTDDNETTTDTITTLTPAMLVGQSLCSDVTHGNWSVGCLPGVVRELFNVGGHLTVSPTRLAGQYIPRAVTQPGVIFVKDWEAVTPVGLAIVYNPALTARGNALTTRLYTSAAGADAVPIGNIGAVRAFASFNNAVIIDATGASFNVASVTKTATGRYTVNFTNAFTVNNYCILLTNQTTAQRVHVFVSTTSTVEVRCVNATTGALEDTVGVIYFACLGGSL